MRVNKVYLPGFERSLQDEQEFAVGPFTVFFGRNNAGKTNLLEDIYHMLSTRAASGGETRIRRRTSARWPQTIRPVQHDLGYPVGALYIDLDPEHPFDQSVLDGFPRWAPVDKGVVRFSPLPPLQVCYASTSRHQPELWFTDVRDYYEQAAEGFDIVVFPEDDENAEVILDVDEQQRATHGPFPQPLFLGWEFNDIDSWVTSAFAQLTAVPEVRNGFVTETTGWLESATSGWRVRSVVEDRLDQLAALATDLLPDFLDGSIHATFYPATQWQELPAVRLTYRERRSLDEHALEDFGRGASRWMGIAVQVALRLIESDSEVSALRPESTGSFSGHVLFVDEPEAHLHHSAVASVVRWCQRMVDCGFNLFAASHHEEFLRSSGEITFVKVTKDLSEDPVMKDIADMSAGRFVGQSTKARTIPGATTSTLQELAAEVGMHPAAALSLQRAILFVEGPLDEAVLDEYASPALDSAGVTIIPIHGTKNLEGLIDGEFTTRLGIKTGVLTDNTVTTTMWQRSKNKRKEEEKKLIRLIELFQERGLPPPTLFGVPEQDLLFALPVDAIRNYLDGPFPDWQLLREECRVAEGRSKSESVDWKAYALEQYGLPLTTPDGVRRVIRSLDLEGVDLPSIRKVVSEVIVWATGQDPIEPLQPDDA